jgi:hypothetical protein
MNKTVNMKNFIFLNLIISLIIGSCAQEKRSPIEGSWKLISGKLTTSRSVMIYPLSEHGNHLKMIGDGYFTTIWQDTYIDKSVWMSSGFNGGTYTFENGVYTETISHFADTTFIGYKTAYKAEIKNDTLTISFPTDKEVSEHTSVEKWKRLK